MGRVWTVSAVLILEVVAEIDMWWLRNAFFNKLLADLIHAFLDIPLHLLDSQIPKIPRTFNGCAELFLATREYAIVQTAESQ